MEEGQGYWDGLVVYWDYSDGSRVPVAKKDYRLTPDTVDTSDSGSLDIKVEAGGYTRYFDMYVSSSTSVLQSISVVAAPSGPFYLGEGFKTAGMVVRGTYNDKTENVPLSAVSADGYSNFKRGEQNVTLRVNGKTVPLTVKTVVKPGTVFYPNEYSTASGQHQDKEMKPAYIKGKEFDFAKSNIQARFSKDSGLSSITLKPGNGVYPEDIKGYNKDVAGKQTLTLDLDGITKTFSVYVLDVQPDVWFDYGFMRHAGDPVGAGAGFGTYHVEQGKTLVLAPVRYLIGYNDDHTAAGTSYDWYVDGVLQNAHTETFAFTPAAAKTYTVKASVTGRNYVDGMSVTKTAETAVVSFAPGTVGEPKTEGVRITKSQWFRNFAPGQFTEGGNGYGWSLGSIGGYWMWKVEHRAMYYIAGNSFGTETGGWVEPGIVWVMEDNNKNGVPDETWYELKGPSDMLETTRPYVTRRYANTWVDVDVGTSSETNGYGQRIRNVCWADCKGRSGLLRGGWSGDWGVTGDWVTFTCTLIGDDGDIANGRYGGKASKRRYPVWDEKNDFYCSYVDGGQARNYINNAIDAKGDPVTLTNVGFVKVHTAEFVYGEIFGELSTEITSADFLK